MTNSGDEYIDQIKEKDFTIADTTEHMVGEFDHLRTFLKQRDWSGAKLHINRLVALSHHLKRKVTGIGATRLWLMLKSMRTYLKWALKHNRSIDQQMKTLDFIENWSEEVARKASLAAKEGKEVELAFP